MYMIPRKGTGELGFKLIPQRHRIVAITQNEVVPDAKVNKRLKD